MHTINAKFTNTQNKGGVLDITFDCQATIPLVISNDDRINELTLETIPVIKTPRPFVMKNDEGEVKFICCLESPVSNNRIDIYQHTTNMEVIVTPEFSYLDSRLALPELSYGCYMLGSDINVPYDNPVINTKTIQRVKLPKMTIKDPKSRLLNLPGLANTSNVNKNFLQKNIRSGSMALGESCLIPLIELGKAKDVFNGEEKIPIYLLSQQFIYEYGLVYCGRHKVKSLGERRLYFVLNF